VHPDVIAVNGAVYGSQYIMVTEPYPYGDDRFENPSLFVSNDGVKWEIPAGITNPIVEQPVRGWNSDADLLRTREGRLHLYYRYNSGYGETSLLSIETNGRGEWTDPAELFTVPTSGQFASPALATLDEHVFLFYVDTIGREIKLLTSTDGMTWKDQRTLLVFPNAWHLDAIVVEGTFYLLVNDKHSLFLIKSKDLERWWVYTPPGRDMKLSRWPAFDENCSPAPLLTPSADGWDNDILYRGSFLIEDALLKLWYSARSSTNVWKVGYSDVEFV
jgi:hypothetical protein